MRTSKILAFVVVMLFNMPNVSSQTETEINSVHGLNVGATAPMFTAIDSDSTEFVLASELKNGPIVLIFYRGFWCPVCNKHLESIQDSLKMIEKTGARVIAISPEKPEYLDKMEEQTKADFTLLYDEDYKIAKAFDVNFKPKKTQLFTYNVILGAKLKDTHSDESQQLPIPATFIINTDGKITWRQFNPDYKNRASVKEILRALDINN